MIAAFIGGYFLLRNSRKTSYERLELLVKARAGWPEGLDGVDTVGKSGRAATRPAGLRQ